MSELTSKEIVHRVCQFLRDEIELAGGNARKCQQCELTVESHYGQGVPGCVLRAQQLIEAAQPSHEPPAVLHLPEPHYNRADDIMEMSPQQWSSVRIAFGALRQQIQRAAPPPGANLKAIAANLRDTATLLRRTPMPLADLIPLLQKAADLLDPSGPTKEVKP
jgi:hypothetical protein